MRLRVRKAGADGRTRRGEPAARRPHLLRDKRHAHTPRVRRAVGDESERPAGWLGERWPMLRAVGEDDGARLALSERIDEARRTVKEFAAHSPRHVIRVLVSMEPSDTVGGQRVGFDGLVCRNIVAVAIHWGQHVDGRSWADKLHLHLDVDLAWRVHLEHKRVGVRMRIH